MNSTRLFLSLILALLLGHVSIQTIFTMNNNNDKKRDISKLNDDESDSEKKQKVEQQEAVLEINWNQKLIEAAQNGNNELLMKAIKNGADVDYKNVDAYWIDDQRNRACDYAVTRGYFDCLKTLIENNAKIYDELIIEAVMVRNIQIIKFLLEQRANPNACIGSSNGESSSNPFGERILMYAAARGYAEIVKLLIAYGADVNATKKDGTTALMLAAQKEPNRSLPCRVGYGTCKVQEDHLKTIKFLLTAPHININAATKYSTYTALFFAAYNVKYYEEKEEFAKALLEAHYMQLFMSSSENIIAFFDSSPIKTDSQLKKKIFAFLCCWKLRSESHVPAFKALPRPVATKLIVKKLLSDEIENLVDATFEYIKEDDYARGKEISALFVKHSIYHQL